LWFTGHDQKSRSAGTLFIEGADKMRPDCRVSGDLDGEFTAVGLRFEDDAGRVHPDLWRPRVELADGGDAIRRSRLDGNGEEMIEGWNRGFKAATGQQQKGRSDMTE